MIAQNGFGLQFSRNLVLLFVATVFFASTVAAQGGGASSGDRLTTREFGFADVQPGFPLNEVGVPNSEIGFIERMIISLNEVEETLRIEALVKPVAGFPFPNALVVVLNGGGIPGEQGEFAYLLLDASDLNDLRFSAFAYSPNGPLGSINDGSVDAGVQPGDVIFAGRADSSEILNMEVSDEDGKRRFIYEIRTTTINAHTPRYPSPTVNWKGIQSTGEAGIWLYTFTDFAATYVDGVPTDAVREGIGGLDTNVTPFPYRPECLATLVSQPAVDDVPGEFFVGQPIEFEGSCLVGDGESAKIEYGPLPEGSVVSQEEGSSVSSGETVLFAIPTDDAQSGDTYAFTFGCSSGSYDLPAVQCELDASVRDAACVGTNNTDLLATLDSLGKDIHKLNRRVARVARRVAPDRRRDIRAGISSSREASNDSWQIWRFTPVETFDCEDGPLVSTLSLTEGEEMYVDSIRRLRREGVGLAKILQREGRKRQARTFIRRIRRKARLAIQQAGDLPSQTDVRA
ncbi:hypothetical protein MRY87_01370 [bacterium]|nr:hypothetical protein [bacterium]